MDFTKKEKKPEPEVDESGKPIITLKYLKANCEYNKGYNTPHLNDVLYLNQKGFRTIENLDEYYNCKVLYLDGNGLRAIQGISHMHGMRCLFLHDNLITKMEGLSQFPLLDTLNLANNLIEKVEGIENCTKLTKLDLSGNKLENYESLSNLRYNTSLNILLLKDNHLPYDERILDLFRLHLHIRYLEMKGNEFIRNCPNYRKVTIARVPTLGYLDDRPVDSNDRLLAQAFVQGGVEEERKVREEIQREKSEREKKEVNRVREQRKTALARWQQSNMEEEIRRQTEFRKEIEAAEAELEKLRIEHVRLKTEEENKIAEEKEKEYQRKLRDLEKRERALRGEDPLPEEPAEEPPALETIEQLEEKYQELIKDPQVPPEVKLILRQQINKRVSEEKLGFKQMTPIEENEFEQEIIENKITNLESRIKASEQQNVALEDCIERSERGDDIAGDIIDEVSKRKNSMRESAHSQSEMDSSDRNDLEAMIVAQSRKQAKEDEEKPDIRWNIDLENSLENLLVSCRFNFDKACTAFNQFLNQKSAKDGSRVVMQTSGQLAKKWAEMQNRRGQVQDDSLSTAHLTDVPDEAKSVHTWDQLD